MGWSRSSLVILRKQADKFGKLHAHTTRVCLYIQYMAAATIGPHAFRQFCPAGEYSTGLGTISRILSAGARKMSKIALLVGIDAYASNPLTGCVADAEAVADLLDRNDDGTPNFECRTLLSDSVQVTRGLLRTETQYLFQRPNVETAIFFFAGHGSHSDALGGHLVTQDAAAGDEGVAMEQIIGLANASPSREKLIILDCCHAGAIGTLLATRGDVPLAEGVSILAACRDTESAVELNGRGLFSTRLCDALEGGAADVTGKISAAGVYAYVDEVSSGWDQRPLLKANLSQITIIRRASESVSNHVLRKITDYFPTADHEFALDPSYEPTEEPQHEEHESIFGDLQAFRAARLVVPNGTPHMYFAALQSRSCSLTPLGRFYWHRVANRQI